MARFRYTQSSFSGGIVSKEIWSRSDFKKLSSCVSEDINFRLRPSGSASFRTGLRYICEAATNQEERLQKFVYTRNDYGIMEFFVDANGCLCMRFIKNKQLVTDGHTPFVMKIKTRWDKGTTDEAYQYNKDNLAKLSIVQNKNNVYIAGIDLVPTVLTRVQDNQWTQDFIRLGFSNRATKPYYIDVQPTGTAKAPVPFDKYYWGASVVLEDGTESEMLKSSAVTADVNLNETPCNVTVKVDMSSMTAEQRQGSQVFIYRVSGGNMYFVYALMYNEGTGADTERTFTLKDPSLALDKSHSEPKIFNRFKNISKDAPVFTDDTPTVVAIYKQRLIVANTKNDPNHYWCSNIGRFDDFTHRLSATDDMAYDREFNAGDEDGIVAFVPMDDLLAGTESKIWRVTGTTGSTAGAFIESYDGMGSRPVVSKKSILYTNSVSGSLNNFLYNYEQNGYTGEELDLLSKELFDGYSILDFDLQNYPLQTIHVIRSDHKMFCITYVKEQNVYGWYKIDTQGDFYSICGVTGRDTDEMYTIVNRFGTMYIECFEPDFDYSDTQSTARFLDSFIEVVKTDGMTRVGPYSRFVGKTLPFYYDGDVSSITFDGDGYADLPEGMKIITGDSFIFGYPYSGTLTTLPKEMTIQNDDTVGIRRRLSTSAFIRVYNTRGIKMGASEDTLEEMKPYGNDEFTSSDAMPLFTGILETTVADETSYETSFIIQQDQPLPAFIQSITTEIDYEYHKG